MDYRETLKPEEFAVFVQLRDWRKLTAEKESVPVYTIFTNEHLAQMVQQRMTTRADLGKIAGVGEGRLDKYAAAALEILGKVWTATDEASRLAA